MKALFEPKSVAVIGASRNPNSVGYGVLKNLRDGGFFLSKYNKPFEGKIFAINPKADEVLGFKCYGSVTKIEDKIDLVIIAVPSKIITPIINEIINKQIKAVIIISAGFGENGEGGKLLQDNIIKKLGKTILLGPNCLGFINTHCNLNASFAPVMPPKGKIALITQSGALADSIIDWAAENNYGFSKIISTGNSAQKDVSDFLEALDKDKQTKVITAYIEGIKDGRRFFNVAKKISKPLVLIKAGKTSSGEKAVGSHTGSLAGSYKVYETAFKQSGCVVADTVEEMFDVAKALAYQPKLKKNGIGIITNGGGAGVLCTDYCSELGIELTEVNKEIWKKLDKHMHPAYSRRNPLDLVGDADVNKYEKSVNALLKEEKINGLIVIQTLQTMTDTLGNAKTIVEASKKFKGKPIICCFLGGKYTKEGITYLEINGIPCYNDVSKAARAMKALMK